MKNIEGVRGSDPGDLLRHFAEQLQGWFTSAALPLWGTAGVDPHNSGFYETLTFDGAPCETFRRARVQARQAFVFANASHLLPGRWLDLATCGIQFLLENGRRPDNLVVTKLSPDGEIVDEAAMLYDQAFVLLATAALHRADPTSGMWANVADGLRAALTVRRHVHGGFREEGLHPFQANAHMHLLEACLEWEFASGGETWAALADEVAELALAKFVDRSSGVLHEYFSPEWVPLGGQQGLLEPGHHFEWAWLLERWGRLRGEVRARDAARQLFERGIFGYDPTKGVVVNSVWHDMTYRDAAARLWPQTEYLKAALILEEDAQARNACRALLNYLDVPRNGLWYDRMEEGGGLVLEPAPASSFYHIAVAVTELSLKCGLPADRTPQARPS